MSEGSCSHGKGMDEECWECDMDAFEQEQEAAQVRDEDVETIQILLDHAPLTGCERDQLEQLLEDEEFKRVDRERFQQIVNQHISTLHQHQK